MTGRLAERDYPTLPELTLEEELDEVERLALCDIANADQLRSEADEMARRAHERLHAVVVARARLTGTITPATMIQDEPDCWESLADF
jgi:hypothetical protein